MKTHFFYDIKPKWLVLMSAIVLSIFIGAILANNFTAHAGPGHAGGHDDESAVAGGSSGYPVVTIQKAKAAQDIAVGVEAAGIILPSAKAEVSPIREGVIKSLSVDVGSIVKEGDVLGELLNDASQLEIQGQIDIAQAETQRLQGELNLIARENAPQLKKLSLNRDNQKNGLNLVKKTQGQVEKEYAVKIASIKSEIERITKSSNNSVSSVEIDKTQLLQRINASIAVKQKAIASVSADLQAQQNRIRTLTESLEDQRQTDKESILLNAIGAVNDVIDTFGEVFFTSPSAIRGLSRTEFSLERSQLFTRSKSAVVSTFYLDVYALVEASRSLTSSTDISIVLGLLRTGSTLTAQARTIVSTSLYPDEKVSTFLEKLDVVSEHVNDSIKEVNSLNTETTRTIKNLQAEGTVLETSAAQRIIELEGEITLLENERSSLGKLTADQGTVVLTKNQQIDALKSDILLLESELSRVLTERSSGYLEKESSIVDTESDIAIVEGEKEIAQSRISLDIEVKKKEIVALQRQLQFGNTIRAPFDGVITKRHLSKGDSTSLDKPVFTLVTKGTKIVRFFVSPSDTAFITNGKRIQFSTTSDPLAKKAGKIIRIAEEVDEETGTILVEASIDPESNKDLITQMSVRVTVPFADSDSTLAIPESAVQLGNENDSVWIVNDQVQIESVRVQVSHIQGGYVFLTSGLTSKNWVVIESPVELTVGMDVDTKQ